MVNALIASSVMQN